MCCTNNARGPDRKRQFALLWSRAGNGDHTWHSGVCLACIEKRCQLWEASWFEMLKCKIIIIIKSESRSWRNVMPPEDLLMYASEYFFSNGIFAESYAYSPIKAFHLVSTSKYLGLLILCVSHYIFIFCQM